MASMKISDKEAFRVLGLPLGVDKEAITKRYKNLSIQLSGSRAPEDKKRLEHVVAAYRQLLPPRQKSNNHSKARHKGQSGAACDDCDSDDMNCDKDWTVLCRNGDSRTNLSQSTTDLTEEEKEQRKVEKRRAKKKRRKEKKKLEKLETQILGQGGGKREDDTPSEEEEEEEEEEDEGEEGQGLDPNSAFVVNAAAKRAMQGGGLGRLGGERASRPHPPPAPRPTSREDRLEHGAGGVTVSLSKARELAKRGNEAASVGQYEAAVKLFTDAIDLDKADHRFLGNRSYCFNQLGYHERALEDAERAITLEPHWAKGHYRMGTALRDLGRFVDAEAAFEEVLRLDSTCREAHEEIQRVKIARILEMGFSERQAVNAVMKYINVQAALDALLSGEFKEATEDVFYSDDEEEFMKRAKVSQGAKDVKMNIKGNSPQNPEGLMSLWVGNVLPEVTERNLTQLFSKYGQVTSVRLLREKYCAFVNFSSKAAAGRAMELLQGYEFCGQKLLIKFPDNPIVPSSQLPLARKHKIHANTNNQAYAAKNTTTTTTTNNSINHTAAAATVFPNSAALQLNGGVPDLGLVLAQAQQAKLRGPVNGDECYFWRTTGCAFGDGCKHQHVPDHQGVDRKPWQK